MLKLNVKKAPQKPRAKKPALVAPNYTLAPAEPCPFVSVPVPAAVPVDVPTFVAGSACIIEGVDWTVALYSDDTIRIVTDDAPVATGRFVTSTHRNEYGYSVESQIVDVTPTVSPDVLRALSSDLTYFAARAGRFSGKVA